MLNEVSTEKEFVFKFRFKNNIWVLKAPINIPLQNSVREYAFRLMNANNLPCQLEPALVNSLKEWVAKETNLWHEKNTSELLSKFSKQSANEFDALLNSWQESYTREHLAYTGVETITNEEVFSDMYHTLVHSQALDSLLSLEHSYAVQMDSLVNKKDEEMRVLQKRQSEEMEKTIQQVGVTTTDETVNSLAVKQLEEIQLLESQKDSEISALRESQKREFKKWVGAVHEDYHIFPESSSFSPTRRLIRDNDNDADAWMPQTTRLEESFTIQLGAQLKQMHNLRLLAANVLDLIHIKPLETQNAVPQRLQTALALYSNNLSGLVLLVDSRVNSYTGIKREFARLCQMSTEFHFESLEEQFEDIRNLTPNVKQWRLNSMLKNMDGNGTSDRAEHQSPRGSTLKPGDVFVTRHSNLSEVHVVFHVVADDSTRSTDISSRHPVILALRNVLKIACLYNITTITLPLLLVHDLEEEMTMTWCMKRAELVYKCVKGFMIEMASWGGSDSRNVQFLVSKSISEALFSSLATMLPSIFRMSNPLKVKP